LYLTKKHPKVLFGRVIKNDYSAVVASASVVTSSVAGVVSVSVSGVVGTTVSSTVVVSSDIVKRIGNK
jgi:hypothetical protein